MTLRILIFLSVLAAALAAAAPAGAQTQSVYHGGTYFGSVVVEPGQVVDGDLTVVAGDATIAGTVDGDVDVIGGNLYERPGAVITGQVHMVGGEIVQAVVPWVPNRSAYAPFVPDHRLLSRISWNVLVLLVFLIFPLRTRMALDRLERHPGLTLAAGLLGCVAVIPLAVLLAITILLIPLIPLELVFLLAGVFLGTAAVALLVGRRLCELISPTTTPSPFVALLTGLILITAAELVPVVGVLVFILIGLVGLGAAILSFVGETLAGPASMAPQAGGRAPASGPPMAAGQ